MHPLAYIFWYIALALSGILLFPGRHWEELALLAAVGLSALGLRLGRLRPQKKGASSSNRVVTPAEGTAQTPWAALPARSQLPLPLVHLLGADCAYCQGIGCHACEYTGLR